MENERIPSHGQRFFGGRLHHPGDQLGGFARHAGLHERADELFGGVMEGLGRQRNDDPLRG